MSSVATSICLKNCGFPIDIINAIASYATTGRWLFLYDNEGNFVRKLNLAGFNKISQNITTKVDNYTFVPPHAIYYNGAVFYPDAITHLHPPMQNENGAMISRSYTSVELAPEVFDYILITETMDDEVGDWIPRDAYVFRPYCDHPIGRAQSIGRYHGDNYVNLTDIHFEPWLDDWEWEPFNGIHLEENVQVDDMMEEWANEWEQDEEQPQEDEEQQPQDNEPQPQEDEYAGIGGDHAWWLDEDSEYEEEEEEDEDEDEAEWNREQRMRGYV
jgi:hypothetical protein